MICTERNLVGDPPAVEPLEVAPLLARSNHAKRDGPEQPVKTNNNRVQYGKDGPADLVVQFPRRPVKTETHSQDSEPQGRVVVVNVGNTTHGHEREVVQNPANDRVKSRVVNLVNFRLLEVVVPALPADNVVDDNEAEDSETGCATPVHKRIAEKEVLDDCTRVRNGLWI
jgi:hypothetical protein